MLITVQRTEVLRECTLGIISAGHDTFFCMEHSMLRGMQPRATREGQYEIHADIAGLYFVDPSDQVVRIDFGSRIERLRYPIILVGCEIKENRLYDAAIAADRLYSLIVHDASNTQIDIRDPLPDRGWQGEMTWRSEG